MLKPRPSYLASWPFSIDPTMWVTINGTIYYPEGINPDGFPWVVAHELVHARQQAKDGWWTFLAKYLLNKGARLEYEAEAIAEELRYSPAGQRARIQEWYCQALAGKPYHQAAETPGKAFEAILRYL